MGWRLDMDAETGLYILEDEQGEFARVTAVRDDHQRAALLVASPDLLRCLSDAICYGCSRRYGDRSEAAIREARGCVTCTGARKVISAALMETKR